MITKYLMLIAISGWFLLALFRCQVSAHESHGRRHHHHDDGDEHDSDVTTSRRLTTTPSESLTTTGQNLTLNVDSQYVTTVLKTLAHSGDNGTSLDNLLSTTPKAHHHEHDHDKSVTSKNRTVEDTEDDDDADDDEDESHESHSTNSSSSAEHHDHDHDPSDHDHSKCLGHDSTETTKIDANYFITEIFNHSDKMSFNSFESLLTLLHIGGHEEDGSSHENHDHHHHHHHHRRRRDVTKTTNDSHEDHHQHHHHHDEHDLEDGCFSSEMIVEIYGLVPGQALSPANFTALCPALIQQQVTKICKKPAPSTGGHGAAKKPKNAPTNIERYGYGTIAAALVSYVPLIILIGVPKQSHRAFSYVMNFLVALGASTLLSDAILHLLPECYGAHGHSHGGGGHHHEHEHEHEHEGEGEVEVTASTIKGTIFLLAIYGMYLLEMLLGVRQRIAKKLPAIKFDGHGHSHSMVPITLDEAFSADSSTGSCDIHDAAKYGSMTKKRSSSQWENSEMPPVVVTSQASRFETHHSDNIIVDYFRTLFWECIPTKSFTWLLILGDCIHNFVDGMAMGATFSKSTVDGFSTSLAIIFHEIPHELGDFGAMMSGGLTWRGAMIWNIIQTFTAFIGLYIGLEISADETALQYIFAFTAGIFIYIAVNGLIPELQHIEEEFWPYFILQNIGIQIGFWIMFLIAIYEEPMSHMF